MNRSNRLILDTSGLNHLADDPERQSLLAGITSGYFPRITSTNIEEIAATVGAQRKKELLDVCQTLRATGECITAYQEITADMIRYFDRGGQFDWRQVPVRFHAAEREIIIREITCDEKLALEQVAELKAQDKVFKKIFGDARPHFDEIFENHGERIEDCKVLVEALQTGKDGAFWAIGADLYMRVTGKEAEEATIRKFVDVCPPFKALLLAICIAEFEYTIRDMRTGTSFRAGRLDLFSAVYLPYCDQFVTADERQHNALKEIVAVGGLETEIVLYQDFRERLLPSFLLSTTA